MADSENSRTVPAITHRNILPAVERFLLGLATDQEAARGEGIDATLAAWNAWLASYREFARLCCLQQRLETNLLNAVGHPYVEIRLPSRATPAVASTEEEIESWLQGEEFADQRQRAKRDLAARLENWDAADESVGFSRAKEAEAAAADHESRLIAALWSLPAVTLPAAAAKLHAIIMHGAPKLDASDFPWLQLRSVLMDMLEMCAGSSDRLPLSGAVKTDAAGHNRSSIHHRRRG
ncbi:MAG: hypothetical protein KGI75_14800 [Rhizobiaceae bacterium]|nr:hypothetical protein [Rhizobiaceae bacterium]